VIKTKLKRVKPVFGVLETTLACNLRCRHCGSSAGAPAQGELSDAEVEGVLCQFADLGTVLMAFTGGEPLLRRNVLGLARTVRDLGMELSFLTNGVAVNERIAREIARLEPAAVSVSIDGIGATHDAFRGVDGSFGRAVNALKLLDAAGAPHCMITTVVKSNIGELERIKELALELDVWTWQIQAGIPIGRLGADEVLAPRQVLEVLDFIRSSRAECRGRVEVVPADCMGYYCEPPERDVAWKGCNAGLCLMSVTSTGNVKGCLSMPDSCVEGNVRERTLREIWEDENAFAYNRSFDANAMKGACRDCEHLGNCRGGCKSAMFALTGGANENPLCQRSVIKNLCTQ